jgi:hypothetical protein
MFAQTLCCPSSRVNVFGLSFRLEYDGSEERENPHPSQNGEGLRHAEIQSQKMGKTPFQVSR